MITKTVEPIIDTSKSSADEYCRRAVIGATAEYRVFGLCVYRKTYYNPEKYGVSNYNLNGYVERI